MKKATALEKAAGSLPTTAALSMAAAAAGGPFAALLPVLAGSLAANRQSQRVESAMKEIESELYTLGDKINQISDAQYKYINESLITVMHTPNDEIAGQFMMQFLLDGIAWLYQGMRAARAGCQESGVRPDRSLIDRCTDHGLATRFSQQSLTRGNSLKNSYHAMVFPFSMSLEVDPRPAVSKK